MDAIEFQGFGKIGRLFRDMVVTEKIDGTNAAVGIKFHALDLHPDFRFPEDNRYKYVDRGGREVNGMVNYAVVYAQSRSRLINPGIDNHGFARWVWDNAETLISDLGEGLHFGEWWGSGINRGYGLPKGEKRFSLFNTHRWAEASENFTTYQLNVVPVLYSGPFSTAAVRQTMGMLNLNGSVAAPGFDRPEGVVIYHRHSNSLFKATLVNDELPKSLVS